VFPVMRRTTPSQTVLWSANLHSGSREPQVLYRFLFRPAKERWNVSGSPYQWLHRLLSCVCFRR